MAHPEQPIQDRPHQLREITPWATETLPMPDTRGELIYLKEWHDSLTDAKGWLARWGDSQLDVSGGGIRMNPGSSPEEAIFLASTMYEKFGIAGPEINGSKFVIDYDPNSHDKLQILERFLAAFLPDLERIGTAGDMGVTEEEAALILSKFKIPNPQFGILNGLGIVENVDRLTEIMHLPLHQGFSPKHQYLVDVAAGWSTCSAIKHYLQQKGESLRGKTVAIHGIGAVGGSTGYYLEQEGAVIVEIADLRGSVRLTNTTFMDVIQDIDPISGCIPRSKNAVQVGDTTNVLYSPVDILVPAAHSDVISVEKASKLQTALIAEGANHPILPEADAYLYERGIVVLPDFVVNAGTAELFTIGMLGTCDVTEEAILGIIARITDNAIEHTMDLAAQEAISYRQAAKVVSTQRLWKQYI